MRGLNDLPLAVDGHGARRSRRAACSNATPGIDPSGNVLANDIDFDGDALHVTDVPHRRRWPGSGTAGVVGGAALRGPYGDLTLNADGSWHYCVDNTLPEVQALRMSGQTLQDIFTYTRARRLRREPHGRAARHHRRPQRHAHRARRRRRRGGGRRHRQRARPGVNPTGNVLDNDTDVDSVANGETKQVDSFANSAGAQAAAGQSLAGLYGQLTLNADGSYSYVVDNANPVVQALRTARRDAHRSLHLHACATRPAPRRRRG